MEGVIKEVHKGPSNNISSDSDLMNVPIELKRFKFNDLPKYIKHMAIHKAICIIPLKTGTKTPINSVKWTKYRGFKNQYPLNQLKRKQGNFAVICGDPNGWGTGYLTILDIDDKELYPIFEDIDTLQVKTPSKGYHLYFWSDKEVKDKDYIGRLFNLDIELRGNPGNLTTLPQSTIINKDGSIGSHKIIKEPKDFKSIKDIPNIEKFIKNRLEAAGYTPNHEVAPIISDNDHITPSISGRWERLLNNIEIEGIVTRLKPFYKKGKRQEICLYLSGWMQKAEISFKSSKQVIELLSKDDNKEINQRVGALKSSYRGLRNIKGSSGIYQLIRSYYEDKHKQINENKRGKLIDKDTKEAFINIHKIVVHPLSILGIKKPLKEISESVKVKKNNKKVFRFLNNRFNIVKDSKANDYWIYNNKSKIYEAYDSHEFLNFLSEQFGKGIYSIEDSNHLLSIFPDIKEESKNYIAFKNCLLNLETLEPEEFNPDEFVTFKIPYDWNPEAKGNSVELKLKEILIDEKGEYSGDESKFIQYLQLVGYCIVENENPRQKLFLIIGDGGSGKSQLIQLLASLFPGSVSSVPLHKFRDTFGLQDLLNKRINTLYDISKEEIKDPSTIKAVTGGDSITINRKYKESVTLPNGLPIKTIGSGNELPKINDSSKATWQRIIKIDLNNLFRGTNKDKKDTMLYKTLLKDYDGISWFIYKSIQEYKKIKEFNEKFILEMTAENTEKEYMKISDPCKYAAQELFENSNDERDFYSIPEIRRMMQELLQKEELRIPKDGKEYNRSIKEIGGEKRQRRINGEVTDGFILIKPIDNNNDPLITRLNYESVISINMEGRSIEDLPIDEKDILMIMNNETLPNKSFTIKELVEYAYNDMNIDKDTVLKILEYWKINKWISVDNSVYINKYEV